MKILSPLSTRFTDDFGWPRHTMVPVTGVLDDLMESFLSPAVTQGSTVNRSHFIQETDDHFAVSMDMPGVKRDDIKVELNENQLKISSERRFGESVQTFERSFTLPTSINRDEIEVQYEDGVLSLLLPKAQAAKPRTLEVKSGSGGGLFSKILGQTAKTENKTEQAN